MTSSKRLETLSKQSSTVILAIVTIVGLRAVEHKKNWRFCVRYRHNRCIHNN
jgi:hypothetical protein